MKLKIKVFLYEDSNENFKNAVNEITNELQHKYSQFEINCHEITYSNKISKENGKKYLKSFSLKVSSIFFFFESNLVCKIVENINSLSILIDGTLEGSIDIQNMLQLQHIPYYNFDFSIQSFVKMIERYINVRSGINSVFILQDQTSNLCYVYIFEMRKK